jgi:hypothetical protein
LVAALVLQPHFLKVSHHGSHNGTPKQSILDRILPPGLPKKVAGISTWTDTYGGIPHEDTNARLKQRTKLWSTLDAKTKLFRDFVFEA